jgi:hypothetical protein
MQGRRTGAARLLVLLAAIAAPSPPSTAKEGCSISGRVTDEAGIPIPFAVVSALRSPFAGTDPPAAPVSGSATDGRGEYCIRELPSGEYFVRATARMRPPSASPACDACCRPNVELETAFFGGSRTLKRATPVAAGNGRRASAIDIVMRRVPAYCVRGEVRDGRGVLLGDVGIALAQESWSAGVLNEGGRFLLTGLPAGSYTVLISDRPKPGRVLARRVIHVSARSTVPIVITVARRSLE